MTTGISGDLQSQRPDRLRAVSISYDLGFLLAKLHAAGSVLNNRMLANLNLKERSYSVLALASSGLEPTQRELADYLRLDPSQIVALVDDLENRGLVERRPGKRDRRAKTVTATAEGADLFKMAQPVMHQAELQVLHALEPDETLTLKKLLAKALGDTECAEAVDGRGVAQTGPRVSMGTSKEGMDQISL